MLFRSLSSSFDDITATAREIAEIPPRPQAPATTFECTATHDTMHERFDIVRSPLDAAQNVITAQMIALSAVFCVPRTLLKLVDNVVQLLGDIKKMMGLNSEDGNDVEVSCSAPVPLLFRSCSFCAS